MEGVSTVCLCGATAPLIAPQGVSPLKMCHLFIYSDFVLFFFLQKLWSKMCQISPPPRKRGLTDVELVTLVCNIVYVPMVAPYHMYRLLKKRQKNVQAM